MEERRKGEAKFVTTKFALEYLQLLSFNMVTLNQVWPEEEANSEAGGCYDIAQSREILLVGEIQEVGMKRSSTYKTPSTLVFGW